MKRVGLDYRPALIGSSGIGRYTRELVRALPEFCSDFEVELFAVFRKDVGARLAPVDHANFRLVSSRFPGRALKWFGALKLVSVETFTGPLDLMQTTDYVDLPIRQRRRVSTIHDLSFLREPRWYEATSRRRIEHVTRTLVREASVVIADSEATRVDLVQFLELSAEQVVVAPLGVNPVFGELEAAPAGPPRLLFCATLEPRKNHLRLLEAFQRLRAVEPEARLTILGRRGWLDDEIVRRLESDPGLRWLANANDADLLREMTAANIVVYPSLWEGFGLPLLEGMAAGRAALSSDRGSMKEIAGDAALLVDPESVDELTDGLIALARDSRLRDDLARRGRERARDFSWRRCAEATVRAWRLALELGS